jgi:putative redox protein
MPTTERVVTATLDAAPYATHLTARGLPFIADEPVEHGGQDRGPAPHELMLAALASCTAITMRMYAERKGWPFAGLRVTVRMQRVQEGREVDTRIHVGLERPEGLTDEQWARMRQIAAACPVHRTLASPIHLMVDEDPPAAPATHG